MAQPDSHAEVDSRSVAQALLLRVQAVFDVAVHGVARRCVVNGALDAARLDAQQGACYELALARADLLAARNVLLAEGSEADTGDSLDGGLALAFASEAIGGVIARVESVFIDLGLDAAELQAICADPAHAALRRHCSGSAALARLGAALARADGELGRVVLDDSVALAQDAFRRFAREVVAPLAERIHRNDLTVPESLLQPMREMGVFGLSIPQDYGGSAPGGREDTTLMIAVTEALSQASVTAAGSLITRPEILARALLAGGTAQQKSHWLPRIAAGDPLVRHRHHRTRFRLRCGKPRAACHAGRRRLATRRRQDLVHLRRQGRACDGRRAH